ncbi:hypothetical protein D5F01_LYC24313, partial [Scomber scombrus]
PAVQGGCPQHNTFTNQTQPDPHILPLVSTFSHTTTALHQTIKRNFTHIQTQHPAFHNRKIISAYRRNPNLQSLLVRSKFTTHGKTPATPFHHHYKTRKFITNPYSQTSLPPHNTYSLSHSNIVYIITCTLCNKHYIGETKNPLLTRLKQHLHNIDKGTLTTHLVTHFQQHSIQYLTISGLEAQDRWTTGQRKRAEKIWIEKLGTITPRGLNDIPNY